jgi:hypothetical protein
MLTGENRGTRRETCHTPAVSTTNPRWTVRGVTPGLCSENPATSRCGTSVDRLKGKTRKAMKQCVAIITGEMNVTYL